MARTGPSVQWRICPAGIDKVGTMLLEQIKRGYVARMRGQNWQFRICNAQRIGFFEHCLERSHVAVERRHVRGRHAIFCTQVDEASSFVQIARCMPPVGTKKYNIARSCDANASERWRIVARVHI